MGNCLKTTLVYGFGLTIAAVSGLVSGRALAQVTPDRTLGAESSVVNPNVIIQGLPSDRIEGGARRGANLFHSFLDFNVAAQRGVYFANPAGVGNIFSRVTGSNVSNIAGRLGVLGGANLFLLNPNGIIFGPNASLDVAGSFLASTARDLLMADGTVYSATNPTASSLLTVSVPLGVQFGKDQPKTTITNRGKLTTGKDLTLEGGNLDLQGQLQAGANLTLKATDTLKIRDTVTEPFVARSGADMLIQGNQSVDILALNHPRTPFVSGGNLSLISDGIVSGDAHFTSGSNFSIQNLSGNPGNFVSLYDPVIQSAGDVTFGAYTGVSLKVEAVGSISATGDIIITGADCVTGSPGCVGGIPATDPDRFALTNNPSLILRAGVDPSTIPVPTPFPINNVPTLGTNFIPPPTPLAPARSIKVEGNISTTSITTPLKVTLTSPGDISTKDIIATSSSPSDYARIELKSTAGSVNLNNARIAASHTDPNLLGGAGDIFINAAVDINIINSSRVESNGDLGRIFLDSGQRLTIDKSTLVATNSSNTPGGTGGQIWIGNTVNPDDITITDSFLRTTSSNQAPGGRITMTVSNTGTIRTNSSTLDASISGSGVVGDGVGLTAPNGTITIDRNSLITTATTTIGTTATTASGSPINITAANGSVTLSGGSVLNATTSTAGTGGNITIGANTVTVNQSSLINTTVQSGGSAKGGDIAITADTFSLIDGGRVQANTFASGNAGNIQLSFTNTANISGFNQQSFLYSGILTETRVGATGTGGTITINPPSRFPSSGNLVGDLTISDGGFLSTRTLSNAAGGTIEINVNNLNVLNGGQVLTTSSSFGDAGSITVNAAGNVTVSGSRSLLPVTNSPFTNPTFTILSLDDLTFNNAADSNVEESGIIPFISLQRNSVPGRIFATQNASGTAADGRDLGATNSVDYYSFAVTQDGSRAIFDVDNGGSNPASTLDTELFLFDAQTGQLLASNDDFPATAGSTSGLDSRIAFNFNSAGRYVLGVGRFNSTASSGNPVTGTSLQPADAYRLQVSVQNRGVGTVNLSDRNPNQALNSGLFSNVQPQFTQTAQVPGGGITERVPGSGIGGKIAVNTRTGRIDLSQGAVINASTAGLGRGGDVQLQTGGGPVLITSGARVEARTTGVFGGDAGDITVNAPDITVSGFNQVNGQTVFSGLLASSDTAKSGVSGAIFINSATKPGNSLRVENGGFLSTLNRSDQNGQGIEVNVTNLQLLNGGQIITAAEGLGRAGDITINSPNIQISGSNPSFVPPPALPNGSGALPWISGGQAINVNALSSSPNSAIDFSTTVPHVTIQGQGGAYDFYRLDNVVAGNRIVADIDNALAPGGGFDTELFLFNSTGNLLTRNDDSRRETGRGSVSNLDSYIDHTFTTPGTYYIAVGKFSSNPNPVLGQVPPNQTSLEGKVPDTTDRYTLQLSIDQRNNLNPNQSASSGLFAQSTAVGGGAGNITVRTSQLNVANQGEVSVSAPQGSAGNLFVFADRVVLDRGTLSATTGQNQGTGANIFLLGNGTFDPNSLLNPQLNSQRIREELEASPALNVLLMRNGSQINANADPDSNANGGNIFINSEAILATGSANKITANAGQGRGGNVFIIAKPLGIYNLEFRASGTVTLNDITATSLAGSSGIVSIAIPDINPARGLNQLPIDLADASKKITPICPIAGQQGASNQFVVSGRGGLPETPASTLSSNVLVGEPATVATQAEATQPNPTVSATKKTSGIEAQGVELGVNGAFILTAHASSVDPHTSWQPFQRCLQPSSN